MVTVAELIEKLKTLDGNKVVKVVGEQNAHFEHWCEWEDLDLAENSDNFYQTESYLFLGGH